MEEYLSVYDESLQYIGRELREKVHLNGKWHYVFHCWVYNKTTGDIILQKRAETKKIFPNAYDASCTGHYSSEETFESTRELEEELGVTCDYKALNHLLDFRDVFMSSQMYDREVSRVHLLIVDEFVPEPLTPDEISAIVACPIGELIAMINGNMRSVSLKVLFGETEDVLIEREMLVPRNPQYYREVMAALEKHITKLSL